MNCFQLVNIIALHLNHYRIFIVFIFLFVDVVAAAATAIKTQKYTKNQEVCRARWQRCVQTNKQTGVKNTQRWLKHVLQRNRRWDD